MTTTTDTTYMLEGDLLEVCDCGTLCPCWIGEDPDNGTCDSFLAYHIERGTIEGVDVSGLTYVAIAHIPGNVLDGNFRVVLYYDGKATPEQLAALKRAFRGQLGGPLADLTRLIGHVYEERVAPIECRVEEGRGVVRIGDVLYAEMEPFRGPNGEPTRLVDSAFSTIPGSPAYVARALINRVNVPEYGLVWEFSGRNAIQGKFRFVG